MISNNAHTIRDEGERGRKHAISNWALSKSFRRRSKGVEFTKSAKVVRDDGDQPARITPGISSELYWKERRTKKGLKFSKVSLDWRRHGLREAKRLPRIGISYIRLEISTIARLYIKRCLSFEFWGIRGRRSVALRRVRE